jgi:type IV pilus assembly protein PilC
MFNYVFKVRSGEGNLVSGSLRADSRTTAVSALKQKGYYLLCVERENQLISILRQSKGFGYRVSTKEKAIFTHQLATLLSAGVRLTTALNALSKQTENKYLVSVIKQLQNDIEQSSSLSEAMEKHPKIFPTVYAAIVGAAEESGSLPETLSTLSNQLKAQVAVNSRMKTALVYPIFLLVVSAAVVGVLTAFVIPKFIELFVNVKQSLPLPTKILVATTNFLKQFWWVLIFGIVGAVCLILTALRNERIKLHLDSLLLKLPVIGYLNQKLQLARFTRTLGSLLNGGVKIIQAVNITKGTTTNTAFAKEITNIEEAILKGSSLAKVIAQQRYFSEIAANIIAVGEETGTLPEMLLEVTNMYDQECESAINSMTDLLGPLMIVVLGAIIGFVVMAILLPIFQTSTMVG